MIAVRKNQIVTQFKQEKPIVPKFPCESDLWHYASIGEAFLDVTEQKASLDRASIMLRADFSLKVIAARGHEKNIIGLQRPKGVGAAWSALKSSRPLHINGPFSNSEQNTAKDDFSLILPFFSNSRARGTMNVSRTDTAFTEREGVWLKFFAALVGEAVYVRDLMRLAKAFGTDPHEVLRSLENEMTHPDTNERQLLWKIADELPADIPTPVRRSVHKRTYWLLWGASQIVNAVRL